MFTVKLMAGALGAELHGVDFPEERFHLLKG
jgi:hypothetical protein